jgi:hypothetical protein
MSTNENDQNLTANNDELDTDEPLVAEKSIKNIEPII